MLNQVEIFTNHFKVVGNTLIKINQEFLETGLKMRNAETKILRDEHMLKLAINQTHYMLVRRYAVENINVMFN